MLHKLRQNKAPLQPSDVRNKTVILRLDCNVPLDSSQIIDDSRLRQALNSIEYMLQNNAKKLIVISHLGRPTGCDSQLSLKVVAKYFKNHLSSFAFCDTNIMQLSRELLSQDKVVLLENVRFYKQEEENGLELAAKIASLGDIYINDAFSASHRSHASINAVGEFIPYYLGPNFCKEIKVLDNILHDDRSKALIIAGKKVSTKFPVLRTLLPKVEYIIIAGAMANTFLVAQGHHVGESFVEASVVNDVKQFIKEAKDSRVKIILPIDFKALHGAIITLDSIKHDDQIMDIGPKSVNTITEALQKVQILLWNGPLGLYEDERFIGATAETAKEIAKMTAAGDLESIIGGGDTAAALNKLNLADKMSYVSTSGGAFLEYIAEGY